MDKNTIEEAAQILWKNLIQRSRISSLPEHCRPRDRATAYAIQAAIARNSEQDVVGWKIAATSSAGQTHIGVDGPLAGRLLSARVFLDGARVSLTGNHMKVAEAEFAFRLGSDLPKREREYGTKDVLAAIESLHPAIEIPDSRYEDFPQVGAAQLVADNACASWFVLGKPVSVDWRNRKLTDHVVSAFRNDTLAGKGSGANVLGDPLTALTWIANELRMYADGLRAGEVITTGTCVVPFAIAQGDRIKADFGEFGSVSAELN